MGSGPEDRGLTPTHETRDLSPGALKTSLQVASKDALAADDAALIRQQRPYLYALSDESIRLAVKEPPMWEYRLYFQALRDLVGNASATSGDTTTPEMTRAPLETANWISERFDEYQRLAERINTLVNTQLQVALGPPGQSGDAAAIVSVANRVVEVYKRFLDIRSEALSQHVWPEMEDVRKEFAKICDGSIEEFQTHPARSLDTLMNALATADENTELVLSFELKLKADTTRFTAALRQAKKRLAAFEESHHL